MKRSLKIVGEVVGVGVILLIMWVTVQSWSSQTTMPGGMNIEGIVMQVEGYCKGKQINSKGTCNSLLKKLQGAIEAHDRGQPDVACNKLNAFANEVQAQAGKKIELAAAEVLINMVTPLCSPVPTATATEIAMSPLPTPTPQPTRDLTDTMIVSVNENGFPRVYQMTFLKDTHTLTQPKLFDFSPEKLGGIYPSPDRQQVVVWEVYGESGWLLRHLNLKTGQSNLLFGDNDPKFDQRSTFLAWSPDSQKGLALGMERSDLGDKAWLVNVNDNSRQPVEIKQRQDDGLIGAITSASFSHDGDKVIYAESDCFQCSSRIWEVPVTGTERKLLFEINQELRVESLTLSPDGSQIAFLLWNESTVGKVNAQAGLYTIRSDGTQTQHSSSALANYADLYAPIWLPDNQSLIFVKAENGNQNLYLANITTQVITQLTHLTGEAPCEWYCLLIKLI